MVYQRKYLRDSMQDALLRRNVAGATLGVDGLIRVQSPTGRVANQYSIWLTMRTPDLSDFRIADASLPAWEIGIVISPGAVDITREAQIQWLVHKNNIACFDVGQILDVAESIHGERL